MINKQSKNKGFTPLEKVINKVSRTNDDLSRKRPKMFRGRGSLTGFTSFELITLISVAVLLVILSFSMILKSREKANITRGYLVLSKILDAQRMWYSVYRNFNPTEDWALLGINSPNVKKDGFVYRFDGWLSGTWIQYRAEGNSWWIYGRINADGYKDMWKELPERTANWKRCRMLSFLLS